MDRSYTQEKINKLAKNYKNKKILLYGAGQFAQEIFENYDLSNLNIIAIADKKFEEISEEALFMGYRAIAPSEICSIDFDLIIITNKDYAYFRKIALELIRDSKNKNSKIKSITGFESLKILRYFLKKLNIFRFINRKIYDYNFSKIKNKGFILYFLNKTDSSIFSFKDTIIGLKNNVNKFFIDTKYPWVANEIFVDEIYKIHFKDFDYKKEYTVFDIGSNKGYASLYFANKPWVKDVYAFELFSQTYNFSKKNIKINKKYIRRKIKQHNFGLGKETTTVKGYYLKHRDGISSLNMEFLKNFAPDEIKNIKKVNCTIKQASQVLRKIIEKNNIDNIIFKIDVEGAEYDIMEDLSNNYSDIFNKICLFVGETHLEYEDFIKYIPMEKFFIEHKKHSENGTCSFEIIKKD